MDDYVKTGLSLAAAWGGQDLMKRILGPTADYYGSQFRNFNEYAFNNVKRVFAVAVRRVGKDVDDGRAVLPRVLKNVIDEAVFCEDELLAEYVGGILATSRTGANRDDRALSFIALVKSMSTYEVRLHYICYCVFAQLFNGLNPSVEEIRSNSPRNLFGITIPRPVLAIAFDFEDDEDYEEIINHATVGLVSRSLLAGHYHSDTNGGTLKVEPTSLGRELADWTFGPRSCGRRIQDLMPEPSAEIEGIEIPEGSRRTSYRPQE